MGNLWSSAADELSTEVLDEYKVGRKDAPPRPPCSLLLLQPEPARCTGSAAVSRTAA